MKKGSIVRGTVDRLEYPNRGIVLTEDGEMLEVKDVIPGQVVEAVVTRGREGASKGRLRSILKRSSMEQAESPCPLSGRCGGCSYQTLPYEEQLKLKEGQIRRLLSKQITDEDFTWEGILPSPRSSGFRNKMEFTFGDEYPGGPMTLGMHVKNSFYDVVTVDCCNIVDEDYRKIVRSTLDFFVSRNIPYYHKKTKEGVLRYLIVRKAVHTGEIMVALITSKVDVSYIYAGFTEMLRELPLEGSIASVWHGMNDSVADTSYCEEIELLYGKPSITENVLGLTFEITPYSFFQTNTLGAEVLYTKVRKYVLTAQSMEEEYAGQERQKRLESQEEQEGQEEQEKQEKQGEQEEQEEQEEQDSIASPSMRIFDLYSGTGTIAQVLSPAAKEIIGVEIVGEAVEAAKLNAERNGLDNCHFICGDVFKTLDSLPKGPDIVILDPPREGVHPKAMTRIAEEFAPPYIVYVSCKATSFVDNLDIMMNHGYRPIRGCCVDMFPGTSHIETIVLLQRQNS